MRRWLVRSDIALVAALPLSLIATAAETQDMAAVILPAQSLEASLKALSRRMHVNILFAPNTIRGVRARALRGASSVDEAIRSLLEGTPLEAVQDASGGFIIRLRPVPKVDGRAASPSHQAVPSPQPTKPPSPAPIPPRVPLADIVVTAFKRGDEAAQDLPAAITVITPARITAAGASTITDLVPLVPGLQVAPVRTNALTFIRGIGTTLSSPNIDPAVAMNLNGASVPMELTAIGLFDVQRIEVLPGPQGTLYGHSATGGVINIVTRKPGTVMSADGFAEVGSYGRAQLQAGADTPLTDHLAIRTAVNFTRHAGYDSNGGDDQHVVAGRLTARWVPDDATSATTVATYSRDRGTGPFNFNVPAFYGPYRAQGFDPRALGLFVDYRALILSQEVARRMGNAWRLTYIAGYDRLDQRTRTAAWSGYPPATLEAAQRNRTLTQELRLNLSSRRLNALAGLFWSHIDAEYVSMTDDQGHPVRTANSIGPLSARNRSWAIFGQGTASIVPRLRVTGGVRFTSSDKYLSGANSTVTSDATDGTGTLETFPYRGSARLHHLDWRLQAEADVATGSLLYAGAATGFTPGGLSAAPAAIGSAAAAAFRPVYLTAYAAGVKTRLLPGDRLVFNAETFFYNYRNYQVSQRNLATGQNIVYTADRAHVYGVQIDARARPLPDDQLAVGLVVQRARSLALTTPAGRFDGYQLPFAPNATLITSYRHLFHLQGGRTFDVFVNGEMTASRWGTYTHASGTFVAPTHSVDATLTYHPAHRAVAISLWSRNLTDALIPTQVTTAPAPVGPGQEFLRAPRTVGARLAFDLSR